VSKNNCWYICSESGSDPYFDSYSACRWLMRLSISNSTVSSLSIVYRFGKMTRHVSRLYHSNLFVNLFRSKSRLWSMRVCTWLISMKCSPFRATISNVTLSDSLGLSILTCSEYSFLLMSNLLRASCKLSNSPSWWFGWPITGGFYGFSFAEFLLTSQPSILEWSHSI
jgi:hypothetical protein